LLRLPLLGICAGGLLLAQAPTRGGSNLRTGVYTDTVLSVANVTARGLRVWFNLPMEGDRVGAESQPLIQPGVTMQDGGKRDVLIVSSMNGLVYAYDANTSDILWVQKAGVPINGSSAIDYFQINDHWSFLSTGVIDQTTNIWYGVDWESKSGVASSGKHWLIGLNLKDGSLAVRVQFPTEFDSVMRKQRSSLALATFSGKKTILGAAGTVAETATNAAGYLFAFDVASKAFTLKKMALKGWGAGIWMGGSGLIVDGTAIIGVTGNGTFAPPNDWGETAFRATYTPPTTSAAGSFVIADWFTPFTDAWREGLAPAAVTQPAIRLAGHSLMPHAAVGPAVDMGENDQDVGASAPSYYQQYHSLNVTGKDGVSYLVNTLKMGMTSLADLVNPQVAHKALLTPPEWYEAYAGNGVSADPASAAEFNKNVVFDGKTHHRHSSDVVYQSPTWGLMSFTGGENGNVRAWQVKATGLTYLANSDDVASPDLANAGGGMTGWNLWASTNGLLFATRPHGDANKSITAGDLFIFDANNFGTRADGSKQLKVLWRSDQPGHGVAPINFLFNKFCPGLTFQGKIYLSTYSAETLVLGLN
jgi:hypothetical protein